MKWMDIFLFYDNKHTVTCLYILSVSVSVFVFVSVSVSLSLSVTHTRSLSELSLIDSSQC